LTGWTVMLRGIRYRAGRSLVVLLLGAAATTAAVLAPAYTRAAQQSVLTDGLRNAPPSATALVAVAEGTADSAPAAHNATGDARALIKGSLTRHPVLNGLVGTGVAGVDADTTIGGESEPLAARLAYRDNVCAHLRLEGECPIDSGQVLVSKRTADAYGIGVGDELDLRFANVPGGRTHGFEVVGLYTPIDQNAGYWGPTGYFTGGAGSPEASATRVDAVFTGDEDDVRLESGATVSMRLEYPLRADEVQLGEVDRVRADLGAVDADLGVQELDLRTELPSILDEVSVDQRAIGRTVPIIAVPLVLLCWFVLFLLVASLVEERGPEIALAKLRGFPAGRAARFGLGEVLLLVMLSAPVGVVAGLALVELAARFVLAEGTHAEIRWPVFAAAVGALLAAGLAALLAGRRTLRKPVLSLLRRVPARGRRAGRRLPLRRAGRPHRAAGPARPATARRRRRHCRRPATRHLVAAAVDRRPPSRPHPGAALGRSARATAGRPPRGRGRDGRRRPARVCRHRLGRRGAGPANPCRARTGRGQRLHRRVRRSPAADLSGTHSGAGRLGDAGPAPQR
jgi:putative ABC transport system permease protein